MKRLSPEEYNEALETAKRETSYDCSFAETYAKALLDAEEENQRLRAKNTELRRVLEFYADENEWLDYKAYAQVEGKICRVDSHFDSDQGKRAREALKEWEK